ncbi:MAG: BspA family leucine-rich repeat surface protein, partial [Clostridia bacterium]|nr:BspA family leucine-rich repeat surface protein [Clostridia bacterium]
VNTTYQMFFNCANLVTLDLSNWNTSNITNMNSMFSLSSKLTTIYVGNNWSTASVEVGDQVFSGCTSLVGGNGTTFHGERADYTYARVDTADTPGYFTLMKTSTLLSGNEINSKLTGTDIIFDRYTTYSNGVGTYIVDGNNVINGLSGVVVSTQDSMTETKIYDVGNTIYVLSDGKIYANDDCSMMFWNNEINSIVFNNFNTNNVINMEAMFEMCFFTDGFVLDLSNWDVTNVTSMLGMFSMTNGLTSIDLTGWNTSNVTNMQSMFSQCFDLTSIIASRAKWSTQSVTNGFSMFGQCSSLPNYDDDCTDHTYCDRYLTYV